jgi:hypothetical protein
MPARAMAAEAISATCVADVFPDERARLFERALEFAKRHVGTEEQLREIAADPSAMSICVRYHGPAYDFVQHLVDESVSRGRGECAICGHAVYFDDRHPDQTPATKLCMNCMVDHLVQLGKVIPASARAKLGCPEWCTFGAE